jgi:hypothetical protein
MSSMSLLAQWISMPLSEFRDEIIQAEKYITQKSSLSYFADLYIFSSHTGQDTMVVSTSEFYYNSKIKLMNFYHLGDFIVQDAKFQVVCDTANKHIMLLDANPAYVTHKQLIDFEMLLKSDSRAMKMSMPNNAKAYKLVFPDGYPFHSAELYFDSQMQLNKYVLYSTQDMADDRDWENIQMVKPRLEIVIRNYAYDKVVEKRKYKTVSDFIKDIDKLILADAYTGYTLMDMRTIRVN